MSACKIIWWRRPQPIDIHAEITTSSHRYFALKECVEAISGLWLGMQGIMWINNPTKNDLAASKPYNLRVAQQVGLEVPSTLITNNPDEAERFVRQHGINNTVYKAFSATEFDWRETRVIKAEEISVIGNVRFAPVIFQEYIPAKFDIRITIIGDQVFAASIYSQETSYKIDYRMSMSAARVEVVKLPRPVIGKLKKLMGELGIIYAAIDMRLTPDDKYVFLELNPAGQWLFIEERTNQPITRTFSKFLMENDK